MSRLKLLLCSKPLYVTSLFCLEGFKIFVPRALKFHTDGLLSVPDFITLASTRGLLYRRLMSFILQKVKTFLHDFLPSIFSLLFLEPPFLRILDLLG